MSITLDLPKEYLDLKKLSLLDRRAIVPHEDLIQPEEDQPTPGRTRYGIIAPIERRPKDDTKVDLSNVQGDVYFKFPKKWERFLFFRIVDLSRFKKDLYLFAPKITSSAQTVNTIVTINNDRSKSDEKVSYGIAFSRAGLRKMNITEPLQDVHFDRGSMVHEKEQLGDMSCYNKLFKTADNTHAVILVTAKLQDTCKAKMNEVRELFKNSIEVLANWEGRVRPREAEHFGYRDGIAQPALIGIGKPTPGQRVVKPGVIILGYPGDPHAQNRPAFTKDGSFMVFRKLEQNVLYLQDYVEQHWKTIPAEINGTQLSDGQRKDLFGARMVGRFKSGVPLALSPYIEDPKYLDPSLINNFDYTEATNGCPFSAHIRKTEARNLEPIVRKEYLDASVIVRSGIPYGPEISDEEREIWKNLSDTERYFAKCNRGLYFVCYQSSLDNGFYRQTTGFANNDFFPIADVLPRKIGQDPIIGGPPPTYEASITGATTIPPNRQGTQLTLNVLNGITLNTQPGKEGPQLAHNYQVSGIVEKVPPFEQKFFATSRGGEYYFVPSIRTVKSWGTPS